MSETLVRMVAELTGHEGDLGDKMEMFISYFNRTMEQSDASCCVILIQL